MSCFIYRIGIYTYNDKEYHNSEDKPMDKIYMFIIDFREYYML